jgi:uncharacterized membrane protein
MKKYIIILSLFVLSLISSAMLLSPENSEFCEIGSPISGCSVVKDTNYSQTLGIDNAYFGILGFSALILITLSQIIKPTKNKKTLLITATTFASIIAIYFLFLQAFIINSFCNYCLVVDISVLTTFFILIFSKKE